MAIDHQSEGGAAHVANDTECSVCLPVPGVAKRPGETLPFRNAKTLHGLRNTPEDGLMTVIDLIRRASTKFGDIDGIGSRTVLATPVCDGVGHNSTDEKQRKKPHLGGYSFMSYTEYENRIFDIGRGLIELGLQARKDKLCIYAQTR